jgi:hypothetical protein
MKILDHENTMSIPFNQEGLDSTCKGKALVSGCVKCGRYPSNHKIKRREEVKRLQVRAKSVRFTAGYAE